MSKRVREVATFHDRRRKSTKLMGAIPDKVPNGKVGTGRPSHPRGDGQRLRHIGGDRLSGLSDCYKKPPPNSLEVGGVKVGIVGMADIMENALAHLDEPEEQVKDVLMAELKARNYVPSSEEGVYLKALWKEYRDVSARRREDVEETYQGIPRDEISWYPRVEESRCEGCSSCVEFCSQGVFAFHDGKSKVVKPYNCIVGKSSCRAFCPDKAISFPTRTQLKSTLTELRTKRGLG